MTEEQIRLIAQQYKAEVLDGLSNKRRKQGASAYLPKDMQKDIAEGKLNLSNDEIISKVLEINLRNPFYLDSKSGSDWTLNPFSTGQ